MKLMPKAMMVAAALLVLLAACGEAPTSPVSSTLVPSNGAAPSSTIAPTGGAAPSPPPAPSVGVVPDISPAPVYALIGDAESVTQAFVEASYADDCEGANSMIDPESPVLEELQKMCALLGADMRNASTDISTLFVFSAPDLCDVDAGICIVRFKLGELRREVSTRQAEDRTYITWLR